MVRFSEPKLIQIFFCPFYKQGTDPFWRARFSYISLTNVYMTYKKAGAARRMTLGQKQLGIVFTSNLKLQIKVERDVELF